MFVFDAYPVAVVVHIGDEELSPLRGFRDVIFVYGCSVDEFGAVYCTRLFDADCDRPAEVCRESGCVLQIPDEDLEIRDVVLGTVILPVHKREWEFYQPKFGRFVGDCNFRTDGFAGGVVRDLGVVAIYGVEIVGVMARIKDALVLFNLVFDLVFVVFQRPVDVRSGVTDRVIEGYSFEGLGFARCNNNWVPGELRLVADKIRQLFFVDVAVAVSRNAVAIDVQGDACFERGARRILRLGG